MLKTDHEIKTELTATRSHSDTQKGPDAGREIADNFLEDQRAQKSIFATQRGGLPSLSGTISAEDLNRGVRPNRGTQIDVPPSDTHRVPMSGTVRPPEEGWGPDDNWQIYKIPNGTSPSDTYVMAGSPRGKDSVLCESRVVDIAANNSFKVPAGRYVCINVGAGPFGGPTRASEVEGVYIKR